MFTRSDLSDLPAVDTPWCVSSGISGVVPAFRRDSEVTVLEGGPLSWRGSCG
jgi:hypothetical protein